MTAQRNRTWAALAPETGPNESLRAGDSVTLSGLNPGTRVRVGTMRRDGNTADLDECWDARYRLAVFAAYGVGEGRLDR